MSLNLLPSNLSYKNCGLRQFSDVCSIENGSFHHSFSCDTCDCRYTELVKLKAVKDKVTLTLTKDVKVVVQADRVSSVLVLICFRQLERFSFECRKTKTKVITLANHNGRKTIQ